MEVTKEMVEAYLMACGGAVVMEFLPAARDLNEPLEAVRLEEEAKAWAAAMELVNNHGFGAIEYAPDPSRIST